MGSVALGLENRTVHEDLYVACGNICPTLEERAREFSAAADLPDCSIQTIVTDDFVSGVQTMGREGLPPLTTERYGGGVAGITLPARTGSTERTILVNVAVFTMDETWTVVHLPAVLAHEVAHCLIELCREQAGAPRGYSSTPAGLLDAVSHSSVCICDEYLADQLAKDLVPPLDVKVSMGGEESETTDRVMLAVDSLGQMRDALDDHVYPALRDRVLEYRETGDDLDGMVNDLCRGIHASLILSSHYRAAIREMPLIDEMVLVAEHPASQLYLAPFWESVGPMLDERLAGPLWFQFGEKDQRMAEVSTEAVLGFWAALGVQLEPLDEGGADVHVDDPRDI